MRYLTVIFSVFSLFLLSSSVAYGAEDLGMSALKLTTNPDGSQEYSVTLQILIFMTALSFIPAAVIMMTSFTRIVVVMATGHSITEGHFFICGFESTNGTVASAF